MAKVKVSATIDRKIVRWVDGQIKTRRLRNRSHAIVDARQGRREEDN